MEIEKEADYPEHEKLEKYDLPDWFCIYMDLQSVFAEFKENDIDKMWEEGLIRRDDLVSMSTDKLLASHSWAEACRIFYERFGRDYTKNEYRITVKGDGPQWYLSTATELLLRNITEVDTKHEWDEENTEAYIRVVNQNKGVT